ncbi:MAG TPA: T9SS type A sorting domain-containing protein [Bacteroidales bacterium]|nr:T9SS type A sorting domain-containing protein [Bacteroidales bacterium]HOR82993.1 T9SS type A sorting domain-containing protein [Bacteroidales bacterium]
MKKAGIILFFLSIGFYSHAGHIRIDVPQVPYLRANTTLAVSPISQEFVAVVSASDVPHIPYNKIVITKMDSNFTPIHTLLFDVPSCYYAIIVHDVIVKQYGGEDNTNEVVILACGEIDGRAFIFKMDYNFDPASAMFYECNPEAVFYSIEAKIDSNKIIVCGRDNQDNGVISVFDYSNMTGLHQMLLVPNYEFHKATYLNGNEYVVSGVRHDRQECGFIFANISNIALSTTLYKFLQPTTIGSHCVTTRDPNNPNHFYLAYSNDDIIYTIYANNGNVIPPLHQIQHHSLTFHLKDIAFDGSRLGFVGYESSMAVGPLANASFVITSDVTFGNIYYFENYISGVQHELHKIKISGGQFYCGGVWDDVGRGMNQNIAKFFFVFENFGDGCHNVRIPSYSDSSIDVKDIPFNTINVECWDTPINGNEVEAYTDGICYDVPVIQKSINISLNVNEFTTDNISVSPNPACDFVTLTIGDVNNMRLCIYDIYGKCLRLLPLEGTSSRIDVSDLSQGVYFFKIQRNKETIKTLKVLKH